MSPKGVLSRRDLLERAPLIAATLAGTGVLPAVLSGCTPADEGKSAGGPAAPSSAFMQAAKAAAGGMAVETALAARLYADLQAHHPDLDTLLSRLTGALRQLGGNGAALAHDPALAGLFADLMGGLYLGVTGPQPARRCVGFETIESYALFDGVLAPPSYAGGEPGSWAMPAPSEQGPR